MAEKNMQRVFELINVLRNIRSQLGIPLQATVNFKVFAKRQDKDLLETLKPQIESISKNHLLGVETEREYQHVGKEFNILLAGMHIVIPLTGVVDAQKQKQKIEEDIKKAKLEIKNKKDLLANHDFSKRAPIEIVEKEKLKLEELVEALKKMEAIRDGFR
jgi:valyl-tRNA synthetase